MNRFWVIWSTRYGGYYIDVFNTKAETERFIERLSDNAAVEYVIEGRELDIKMIKVATKVELVPK
jgi:hypothetical protein